MKPDVHVVVRTAGERTSELCVALAREQLPHGCGLSIVQEVPFEKALVECYRVGLLAGCNWTITVDADVLLLPHAVRQMVTAAESMPSNFVQLEGLILDKIFGIYRHAGHRIYRTGLLSEAVRYVPQPGTAIRPESRVLSQMELAGFPSRQVCDISGIHDFEQFYADLYRKSFIHAVKHRQFFLDIVDRCIIGRSEDEDFRAILLGLWDGLTSGRAAVIDRRPFQLPAAEALGSVGLQEKPPIVDIAGAVCRFHELLPTVLNNVPAPTFEPLDHPSHPRRPSFARRWRQRARDRFARHGPLLVSISLFGAILREAGNALDREQVRR